MNPYDWQRHRPQVEIERAEVKAVAEKVARGKSGVLLAGRGMGKSVFLRQVAEAVERLLGDEVRVVLVREPPSRLTVEECVKELAEALELPVSGTPSIRRLLETYDADPSRPGRLVILYDEFDRYGRPPDVPHASPPGREFFNNLESVRRDYSELGVMAAGSLGVFVFRDALGSSFLARAEALRIRPFGFDELHRLARPFAERGEELSEQTAVALLLASGGNPALLTYGLECLWPLEQPADHHVAKVFAGFEKQHKEFLRDFHLSFADPVLSRAPQRVWDLVQRSGGRVRHEDLKAACAGAEHGPLRLSFDDALDLLEAAGLVRIGGALSVDPVVVRPVASILNLQVSAVEAPRLAEQLRRDLTALLGRVHAAGADFFRPGGAGGDGKVLVPEAAFAAFLALGLEMLGWQVDRESQSARGRTDLKLRWNGGREVALIELKIWGRKGYRDVQRQIESYWSAEVTAGAVVMLTDAEISDWPDRYRRQCLAAVNAEWNAPEDMAVRGWFSCRTSTADGLAARVDHFLVRVPR